MDAMAVVETESSLRSSVLTGLSPAVRSGS